MNTTHDPLDDTASIKSLAVMYAPSVLIVEDDPGFIQFVSVIAQRAGMRARLAGSAEQAIKLHAEEFSPIAIVDRKLPEMDGIELVRYFRSLDRYVYIIMCTTSDSDDEQQVGMDAGVDRYISKGTPAALFTKKLKAAIRIVAEMYRERAVADAKRRQAHTDELTGLFNRRHYDAQLEQDVGDAVATRTELGLILLDIDKFKLINDTHGHPIGDTVIKALGNMVSAMTRPTDWCARVGGEEFAIVLPRTTLAGTMVLGDRLIKQVAATPIKTGIGPLKITISAGVSASTEDSRPTPKLMHEAADRLLYKSKTMGRNRVSFPVIKKRVSA